MSCTLSVVSYGFLAVSDPEVSAVISISLVVDLLFYVLAYCTFKSYTVNCNPSFCSAQYRRSFVTSTRLWFSTRFLCLACFPVDASSLKLKDAQTAKIFDRNCFHFLIWIMSLRLMTQLSSLYYFYYPIYNYLSYKYNSLALQFFFCCHENKSGCFYCLCDRFDGSHDN